MLNRLDSLFDLKRTRDVFRDSLECVWFAAAESVLYNEDRNQLKRLGLK